MPEQPSDRESKLWDAMYGDVKFLVLEYKLRDSWATKESAQEAIVQLLQYHGKAQQEYWKHIRTLRLLSVTSRLLKGNLSEDVVRVVRKTDRTLFRDYQAYIAKFWNWEFINKRQGAKRAGNSPYRKWNWIATREALKELASNRPTTFRRLLKHLEAQLEGYKPVKPPALIRVIRYMRDIEFDMEPVHEQVGRNQKTA